MSEVPQQEATPAERLANNVKRLRIEKFGTVTEACKASKQQEGYKGISVPRWYRLEQGQHPAMVGELLDELAALFGVKPTDLLRPTSRRKPHVQNGNARNGHHPVKSKKSGAKPKARPKSLSRG